jgi:hypothetical protein
MSISDEHIELYSGSRNRLLYSLPSSFDIPFSSTQQIIYSNNSNKAQDPIINGAVYYTFSFQPCQIENINVGIYKGLLASYSTNTSFYIAAFQNTTYKYPYSDNFFSGYNIQLTGSNDIRIIRSFNPQSGLLTINEPWTDNTVSPSNANFVLYFSFPTFNYIGIPSIDDNGNFSINTEGAYNGYYVIFETPYSAYSNQYNSNIFYRKITYYDNINRLAYFDTPLPFDYRDNNGNYPLTIEPQTVTLRKSLPLERWECSNIYYNKILSNPIIGPLVGTVVVLPEGSSDVDNYYKGKYLYYYSRKTEKNINVTYDSSNVLLQNLENYIDKTLFNPIYGVYYIRAYNAQTRELSIDQDINNTSCGENVYIDFPSAFDSGLSASSEDIHGINNAEFFRTEPSPGIYRININNAPISFPYVSIRIFVPNIEPGKKYNFTWTIRKSPSANILRLSQIKNGRFTILNVNFEVQNQFTTFTTEIFDIGFGSSFDFVFYIEYSDPDLQKYIEWNFLQVGSSVSLNITDFSNDNYTPLDYIGTMVDMNQTVCYELSLVSLTLPNLNLKTGSRISFYPYVYIQLENVSSPNKASKQIIYSNNPNSNNALFIAPVGLITNPNSGTFLTLRSKMTQTIKFKPNDNLRFSVFFSDGKLFETYIIDTLPPYEPDPRLQIEAVFKILRKTIATL